MRSHFDEFICCDGTRHIRPTLALIRWFSCLLRNTFSHFVLVIWLNGLHLSLIPIPTHAHEHSTDTFWAITSAVCCANGLFVGRGVSHVRTSSVIFRREMCGETKCSTNKLFCRRPLLSARSSARCHYVHRVCIWCGWLLLLATDASITLQIDENRPEAKWRFCI